MVKLKIVLELDAIQKNTNLHYFDLFGVLWPFLLVLLNVV